MIPQPMLPSLFFLLQVTPVIPVKAGYIDAINAVTQAVL